LGSIATAQLDSAVFSARYHSGRYFLVLPSPADRLVVLNATDLAVLADIPLAAGADPRDVAIVDTDTAVVGQRGRPTLLKVDLPTRQSSEIDLNVFGDADGNPDAMMLANCGARVFVQLQRTDSLSPMLAVVDTDPQGNDQVIDVDPGAPGTQGIALQFPPAFDMQIDCVEAKLYVVEPLPLYQGGGVVQQVDLATYTADDLSLELYGEVGGFVMTAPDAGWIILHTEFGPAPSSHLSPFSPGVPPHSVWDTFAEAHIDNLQYDAPSSQVFFPDACTTTCPSEHHPGLEVFDAQTDERLTPNGIDVGFAPVEVVIARKPSR